MQVSQLNLSNDISAKNNLRSVVLRLIEVVRQDLETLNELISKSDPWVAEKQKNVQKEKRIRCKEMINMMQTVLKAEDKRELELVFTEERSRDKMRKRNVMERYDMMFYTNQKLNLIIINLLLFIPN